MTKRGFGWLPDIPDQRDFKYETSFAPMEVLPVSTDLRDKCSKIEDQKQLGSCTAQALVGALEFLEKQTDPTPTNLSRLFVYYNERVIEHSVQSDSGAMIRDGIKTLVNDGVCSEIKWPYIISRFTNHPPATCYTLAAKHKISTYYRITDLTSMKQCLAAGFPFIFGFTVYESFMSDEVATTGVVNMPGHSEQVVGGHAVLAVGYNDEENRFAVRNSWGTKWGQAGYFTMPYNYVANTDLADDMWTIRK